MKPNNLFELSLDFWLEESEHGKSFTFGLYGIADYIHKLSSQIKQNEMLPLNVTEFNGERHLSLLKDEILCYVISIVCLRRLIDILKLDKDTNEKFLVRKQALWGSSDVIPEGLVRYDIDIAIAGDRRYSFALESRYIDFAKESKAEQLAEFLEEVYTNVRNEISIGVGD